MRKLYRITLCLLLFAGIHLQLSSQETEGRESSFSADGPYILYETEGPTRVISVTAEGKVDEKEYESLPDGFGFEVVSHDGKHHFPVKLHKVERPEWNCPQPEKLFVMSDPHGNLDCVVSLLQANGVMDENYHWSYGKNQLVVNGDVFDRGDDVLQIFWLLYKLEEEAAEAGGRRDLFLGNQLPLVLMNDVRYTKPKYKQLADTLKVSYASLFSRSTELGHWLCTRNTMMRVGDNLFVHAGLSKQFYDEDLSIPTVNEQMSHGLYMRKADRKADSPLTYFLFGSYGPVWYRGMVKQDEKYHPLAADTLGMILRKYEAKRVIVGHTVFDDISTFYDNQVIAVNVDNLKNREAKRGRAILIENGQVFVVGDEGILRRLF